MSREYLLYTETNIDTTLKKKHIPALDLTLEWQRIHEQLWENSEDSPLKTSRRLRFTYNAECYLKEAIGICNSFPSYTITVDQEGNTTLYADGYKGPVREVFNPDRLDPEHPWPEYRLHGINYERARTEYAAFCLFEKNFRYREGDVYIWDSLPPTAILNDASITLEEKKERLAALGYGCHTNTMVLKVHDGKLHGRVLPNYLTPIAHKKLFKDLTGKSELETDLELLARIEKVRSDTGEAEIKAMIEELSRIPDYQLDIPQELQDKYYVSEQTVDNIFKQVKPLLDQVYFLLLHVEKGELQDPKIQDLIVGRTHAWENAVLMLLNGGEVNIPLLEGLSCNDIEQLAIQEFGERKRSKKILSQNRDYKYDFTVNTEIPYKLLMVSAMIDNLQSKGSILGVTGCGIGIGFGSTLDTLSRYNPFKQIKVLPMNYYGAEQLKLRGLKKVNCPQCGKEVVFNAQEVLDAGFLECTCGNRTDCVEPIVTAAKEVI